MDSEIEYDYGRVYLNGGSCFFNLQSDPFGIQRTIRAFNSALWGISKIIC